MDKAEFVIASKNELVKKSAEELKAKFSLEPIEKRLNDEAKISGFKYEILRKLSTSYKDFEKDAWIKISEKGGFGAFWKDDPSGIISIKSVGEFPNFTPIELAAILESNDLKKRYDEQFKDGKTIHETPNKIQLIHLMYNGKFPAKQRDFAMASAWCYINEDKTLVNINASIKDDSIPETKDYVRAIAHKAFVIIKSNGKGGSIGIYMANVDLSGSLPGFIKNWASKGQAELMENIYKALEIKKK